MIASIQRGRDFESRHTLRARSSKPLSMLIANPYPVPTPSQPATGPYWLPFGNPKTTSHQHTLNVWQPVDFFLVAVSFFRTVTTAHPRAQRAVHFLDPN